MASLRLLLTGVIKARSGQSTPQVTLAIELEVPGVELVSSPSGSLAFRFVGLWVCGGGRRFSPKS